MELKLYSREWCSWCIDAKDYLSEKGYRFREIDVGKDRKAYEEMKQLSAQTYVPTFVAGDKVLANFDTGQLEKFLNEHQINPLMLFPILVTLGAALLSVGLRSFQNSYAQKAGALGILATTFLAVYFISGSWVLGLAAAVSWLFLPWLEILTRIRALRLPKEKQLRPKSPPSSDAFPALSEITREIEEEGFVHVGDAGWDWEDYRQFFRLFYKEEDRAQAAICLNEQHDLSFYYLRISSRAKNGTVWTTWNYPLSYGLKLTPQFRINRQRSDQSFWQLYQSHREFLRRNGVDASAIDALDEERIQTEMENDLRDQIAHNIHKGVLKQTATGDVKYSWRGMIYLWCQFLVDLVRL